MKKYGTKNTAVFLYDDLDWYKDFNKLKVKPGEPSCTIKCPTCTLQHYYNATKRFPKSSTYARFVNIEWPNEEFSGLVAKRVKRRKQRLLKKQIKASIAIGNVWRSYRAQQDVTALLRSIYEKIWNNKNKWLGPYALIKKILISVVVVVVFCYFQCFYCTCTISSITVTWFGHVCLSCNSG